MKKEIKDKANSFLDEMSKIGVKCIILLESENYTSTRIDPKISLNSLESMISDCAEILIDRNRTPTIHLN